MMTSYARVRTDYASQYLIALSKDWMRRLPAVTHDYTRAMIPFPIGACQLDAHENYLVVMLSAKTQSDAALLEDLISHQLDRLAGGEELHYQWVQTGHEEPVVTPVPDNRFDGFAAH